MRLNRRNVLLGLGTMVVGGGGALATGAFSTVEATRDVSITTEGDSSAFLQLAAGSNSHVTDDDGALTITLEKVNVDGKTTITDAFTIGNNSNQDFDLSAEIGSYGSGITDSSTPSVTDVDGAIEILVDTSGDGDKDTNVLNTTLSVAQSDEFDADFVVDTTGLVDDSNDYYQGELVQNIELTAESTS